MHPSSSRSNPQGTTRRSFLHTVAAGAALTSLPRFSQASTPKRPNVLWVVNDASRCHNYHCYGYERETSPYIDTLAERGVLFENAYSQYFWTAPSVSSYMTGRYFPDRVANLTGPGRGVALREPADEVLAPRLFSSNGYRTLMVSANNVWVGMQNRLAAAFTDAVPAVSTAFDRQRKDGRPLHAPSFPGINERVLPWLNKYGEEPFFIYIHALETHTPYIIPSAAPYNQWIDEDYESALITNFSLEGGEHDASPEDVAYLKGLYDGSIRYADQYLEKIEARLRRLGVFDNTIIIYGSDHGEYLLDDGRLAGHGYGAGADESCHVPLIMMGPGIPKGHRVKTAAQNVDILATLAALCGLELRGPTDGTPLTEFFTHEAPDRLARCVYSDIGWPVSSVLLTNGRTKAEMATETEESTFWRQPDRLGARHELRREEVEGATVDLFSSVSEEMHEMSGKAVDRLAPKAYMLDLRQAGIGFYHILRGKLVARDEENEPVFAGVWSHGKTRQAALCYTPSGEEEESMLLLKPNQFGVRGRFRFFIEASCEQAGRHLALGLYSLDGGVKQGQFAVDLPAGDLQLVELGTADIREKGFSVLLVPTKQAVSLGRLFFYTEEEAVRDDALKVFAAWRGKTDDAEADAERLEAMEALGYL